MNRNSGSKIKNRPDTVLKVKETSELMEFLVSNVSHKNKNNIKALLRNKQVSVNGVNQTQFNHQLNSGDEVKIRWNRVSETKPLRGISIVYEDKDIIVIEKHSGLLSIPSNREHKKTAINILSDHLKIRKVNEELHIINMLDRETSGLILFARSEDVKQAIVSNWAEVVTQRAYLAIVEGKPEKKEDTIESFLIESKSMVVHSTDNSKNGVHAVTSYKVLKSSNKYSVLRIETETSRKNQIRVHMKDIGHSIVGDKKYGAETDPINRICLHAWVLGIKHPITGEELRFETTKPRKFLRVL